MTNQQSFNKQGTQNPAVKKKHTNTHTTRGAVHNANMTNTQHMHTTDSNSINLYGDHTRSVVPVYKP